MRAFLVVLSLLVVGAAVAPRLVSAQIPPPEVEMDLANDTDDDGVLIEAGDASLDDDAQDVGDDWTLTVPTSGNFADLYVVIPNPDGRPVVPHGRVDLPTATVSFDAVLWEDVDEDGLYGEGVDNVLDTDTTDSNGYYDMDLPVNFSGEAGVLIYLGDEFDNGDDITGCVGCTQ